MNRTFLVITTSISFALLVVGCGTVGGHSPLVTANQTEAPSPENNLIVADILINPTGFSLTDLVVRHTGTGRIYSFPFVDNVIMGSKRLDVEKVNFGDQQVNKHVLFLDLPIGTYQVTTLSFGNEGSNIVVLRYDDLDGLFLGVDNDSPTYLGELLIVLDDGIPRSPLGRKVAIGFSPIDANADKVRTLKQSYPAVRNLDFSLGHITQEQ